MKLYYAPISSYSQKVLVALHEKGVEFEREIVNLMDADAHAEYKKVYPLGKVPCLFRDDGHMIPESTSIIEYLDQAYAPGSLIPASPEAARKVRFKDRMMDNYVNDNVVTLFFQAMKPVEKRDTDRIEKARFQIGVLYDFMEHEFGQQKWLCGDSFSMADCAAAPALFYAQQLAPFADRPNIVRYWNDLSTRESVKRVYEEVKPFVDAMQSAVATA